jgi:hypothetical protein
MRSRHRPRRARPRREHIGGAQEELGKQTGKGARGMLDIGRGGNVSRRIRLMRGLKPVRPQRSGRKRDYGRLFAPTLRPVGLTDLSLSCEPPRTPAATNGAAVAATNEDFGGSELQRT